MLQRVFELLARLPPGPRCRLTRAFMSAVWKRAADEVLIGRERVPEGPCLFISNHLSNADGFTLQRALGSRRVWFVAGNKLQSTVMTRIASEVVDTVPIRPGSADVEAVRRAIELLRRGSSVLIFPEGTRSRSASLLRGKKGVALVASRAGVPIVPVALTGTERMMPIDDRDMGGERIRRARVVVRFGEPFSYADVEPRGPVDDRRQAAVDAMMARIAELLPEEYRGVYGHQPGSLLEHPGELAPGEQPGAPTEL